MKEPTNYYEPSRWHDINECRRCGDTERFTDRTVGYRCDSVCATCGETRWETHDWTRCPCSDCDDERTLQMGKSYDPERYATL